MNQSTKEILRQLDEQYRDFEALVAAEPTDLISASLTVYYSYSIPWIVEALFACGFVYSQDLGPTHKYTHPDYPNFRVFLRRSPGARWDTHVTMNWTP